MYFGRWVVIEQGALSDHFNLKGYGIVLDCPLWHTKKIPCSKYI